MIANYTPEQVAEMVATYTASPTPTTVESLASKYAKSTRSVIAKLAKEEVYHSKTREPGKRDMLKSEMVTELATLIGATEEQLESLEKANGAALKLLIKALS